MTGRFLDSPKYATIYILFIGRMGGTITVWKAITSGVPIWGITALAAAIIYVGYYIYDKRRG